MSKSKENKAHDKSHKTAFYIRRLYHYLLLAIFIVLTASLWLIFSVAHKSSDVELESIDSIDYSTKETLGIDNTQQNELIKADNFLIENFPQIFQTPELPTGCEITALTMVLNYYGYDVDKTVMASEYLPTLSNTGLYYSSDGTPIGNDLNNYFIGNPFTAYGIVCGIPALITASTDYMDSVGGTLTAIDTTGYSPEELYALVEKNIPVVVLATIYMADRYSPSGYWYTEDGTYVDWSKNDHGSVLIGYSNDTVTIADPISGIVEYDRAQFEKVYASRGSKSMILDTDQ